MNAKLVVNQECHGLELYFPEKPDEEVLMQLKSARWRYHRVKKCWYLEIQKGDEFAIIKIEASALRCMDDSYYSPWRMDAPSRYKLVERFGKNTDVYPDDVVKITYGRKVLYERKAEVSKS